MRTVRKIIQIDEDRCDGCGQCIISCAEGALEIIDGKAKVIRDNLCDGLGACIGQCPQEALEIIEREADEFDEAAVEAHLASSGGTQKRVLPSTSGCPSAQIQHFTATSVKQKGPVSVNTAADDHQDSALSHWPVQIRLIPPTAPFLRGADLLIVADCVPVAFPSLHQDLMKNRVIMIGCPKFDDGQEYIEKFTAIFKTAAIRSITTVVMEVPCCAGLPAMVKKGLALSGQPIPLEQLTVSTRGKIIDCRKVA